MGRSLGVVGLRSLKNPQEVDLNPRRKKQVAVVVFGKVDQNMQACSKTE